MTVVRLPWTTPSSISPPSEALVDRHGRTFDYLRIALTERCNLRCVYCLPEAGIPLAAAEKLLRMDEILRVIAVSAGLGVTKVRFTGGEPLLHPDLEELISETAKIAGVESIHLTTNGLLLAERVSQLRQAGLEGVNISLDTLRPSRFKELARRDGLERVLAGLHAALAAGFPVVKLNVVALRGFNDDELGDFVTLTRELPITVRFIELMPFDAHQIWKTGRFLGVEVMRDRLRRRFSTLVAASGSATESLVFRLPDCPGKIALIPAYSRSMCGNCNRVRITADGHVRNCLYAAREQDLMGILRGGGSDNQLAAALQAAMGSKPRDGWAAQRTVQTGLIGSARESMTQIGG
jgi:cyclic pyranopterin phosphate synthase